MMKKINLAIIPLTTLSSTTFAGDYYGGVNIASGELNYNFIQWNDLEDLRDNSIIEQSSNFYGLALNLNYKF